ncbi:hypothetical protein BDY21DRAFT_339866 [Lineolata rhizophorae]|uniref:Uncharacterized protein n=1 Tax=Lineolata rhizophorae TaxID=578093 RepID=A0A6A6P5N8_9PEZI|nr:hypothetical protein BDY21DRAFT_339866 [Lineolata rhizophorae]
MAASRTQSTAKAQQPETNPSDSERKEKKSITFQTITPKAPTPTQHLRLAHHPHDSPSLSPNHPPL